jgi:glutamate-1-semialdehyde 2,1-aminomutase
MLFDVATPDAYRRIDGLRERTVAGLQASIDRHQLEAHVLAVGAKGCVVFRDEPVTDYRSFSSLDDRYNHAHWLMQHNGGVFLPPWGKTEQWLISTQHDEADVDRFVSNFDRLAGSLTG